MEFTYCKLIDVLNDIHSGGTPSTGESSYWGGHIKWLSSGETGQRFIRDTVDKITQEGIMHSSTKLAKKHNVVMACAGQGKTRGQTSFLLDDMYINQSVIALQPKQQVLPLYQLAKNKNLNLFKRTMNQLTMNLNKKILGQPRITHKARIITKPQQKVIPVHSNQLALV